MKCENVKKNYCIYSIKLYLSFFSIIRYKILSNINIIVPKVIFYYVLYYYVYDFNSHNLKNIQFDFLSILLLYSIFLYLLKSIYLLVII